MGRNPLCRDPFVHGVLLDAEVFGDLVNGKVSVFHTHNLLEGQPIQVDPSWSSLESDRRPDAKGQYQNGPCLIWMAPGSHWTHIISILTFITSYLTKLDQNTFLKNAIPKALFTLSVGEKVT